VAVIFDEWFKCLKMAVLTRLTMYNQAFDGADDYVWSKETDTVLQKYGAPYSTDEDDAVVPDIARSISSRRSSVSSDIFFDARSEGFDSSDNQKMLSRSPSTFSMYGTPKGGRTPALTPVNSNLALNKITIPHSSRQVDYSSLAYLRSWLNIMTNNLGRSNSRDLPVKVPTINVKEHNVIQSVINQQYGSFPNDEINGADDDADDDGLYLSPRTSNAISPPQTPIPTGYPNNGGDISQKSEFIRYWLMFQSKCRKGIQKLTRIMLRYHSALYWVLVYLLLRGGVTELINYTLQATVKLIAANGGLGMGEGAFNNKPHGVMSRIFSSLMEEFPGRLAL
jgi:hypothetical protein